MVPPLPFVNRLTLYGLFGVCPLLFFTDLTRNPYYTQIMLLNVFVCLIWIVWLWQAQRQTEWTWVGTDLDWPLLALLGWSLITWVASWVTHAGVRSAIYSEGSKAAVFLMVNTFLVYAMVLRLQDEPLRRRLLWIAYAVAAGAALYGTGQYFGWEWIWQRTLNPYGSRPVSTFGNPNFMSSYLVLVIPVMVGDYLYRVTGAPRGLLFVGILASLGGLIATLTRSSWAGLVAALAILALGMAWWPATRRGMSQKALIWLAASFILMAALWPKNAGGVYSETVVGRLTEVAQFSKGSYAPVSQRLLIWTSAWSMVQDHPIVGKGWGCFELFYPFYQGPQLLEERFRDFRTHANNCHNELLEYLSQTGLIGFGLMIWLWAVFFRQSASIAPRLEDGAQVLHWGFVAGVAGMLVDNLLNVSKHFAVPAFLFWWWVGSAFVQDPAAVRLVPVRVTPGRRLVAWGLMVGLALLIGRAFMLWMGEIQFFEGFKRSKTGDLPGAAKALERAHAWHRLEVNNNYELANVYARMAEREKAIHMYGEALAANAGYDEIYFNRGTVLAQVGKPLDAIPDYRITMAMNPLSHDVYNALATVYFRDAQKNAAALEALYKTALRVFPNDRDFWNNLGYLYTQQKRQPEAYGAYRRALEIDPDFELARRNLATIAATMPEKRHDPLLTLPQRFAEVDRLLDARRYADAEQKTAELCRLVPNSFRAWFLAGNAAFLSGQFDVAAERFKRSAELQPGAATTWQNLGISLDRLGRTADADEAWRRALAADPNLAQAKARLGR